MNWLYSLFFKEEFQPRITFWFLSLAVYGTFVWVLVHFIRKYW